MSDYSQQLRADDIDECPALTSYHALDPAYQEIRLMRLTETGVEVEKFALQAAPRYHAISYYWGLPWPKRPIRVGEELIEVRESVTEIFEILRARYSLEEWYWMDIFCINQHNLAERNDQVSFMTEIYSHAADVLSWLGPSTPQSHDVFRLVHTALCCPENAPPRLLNDKNAQLANQGFKGGKWPSVTDLEADQELYLRFAESTVWPAFDDVLARPYWSRMWVVQEVIVARQSYILCGSDLCSLDDLVKVGDLWVRKSQICQLNPDTSTLEIVDCAKSQHSVDTWAPLDKLIKYRSQYHSKEIKLMELVDSYGTKHCINILDKVYALRALSSEAGTITVDYSKSTIEVFLSLVRSGLLVSDNGRGFQSLPDFAWSMGIDRDTLSKTLHAVDEVLIPVEGMLIGTALHHQETSGTLPERFVGITVISDSTDAQKKHTYTSLYAKDAKNFMSRVQVGDMLCVVPTAEPILLLLRRRQNQTATSFDAIANIHHWAEPISDEMSKHIPVAGQIVVRSVASSSETLQKRRLMTSSRSLPELFMWNAIRDKRYTFI